MLSKFPPEVIRHIFKFLSDEDIYICSGTSRLWYELSNWELSSRKSIPVYRWPANLQIDSDGIAIIGNKSLTEFVQKSQATLKHICIGADDTNVLPTKTFHLLLDKAKDCLKKLEIFNFELESEHFEIILMYSQNTLLNIKVKKMEDLSIRSLKKLLDYREFLQGFTVECVELQRAIICYPDLRTDCEIILPNDVRSIIMFSSGIKSIRLSPTIRLHSLSIKEANKLDSTALVLLSTIYTLKHFYIENLNSKEVTSLHLSAVLKEGFKSLYSLGLINCIQVNDNIIKIIAKKQNLNQLRLDIRFVQQSNNCFNMIKQLKKLHYLKLLLYTNIDLQSITNNCKKFCPNLKKFELNYYYQCNTELPFDAYSDVCLSYNRTHQRLYDWWDEWVFSSLQDKQWI